MAPLAPHYESLLTARAALARARAEVRRAQERRLGSSPAQVAEAVADADGALERLDRVLAQLRPAGRGGQAQPQCALA